MNPGAFSEAQPSALRAIIPDFLAAFIADADAALSNRTRTAEALAGFDDAAITELARAIATLGDEDRIYRALPLARAISRAFCRDVIEVELTGVEHLVAAAANGPTLIVSNHLSFIDTTATDAALAWAGHGPLADRIVAIAGPKVYSDTFRRFAAACLSTLPTPQSTQIEGADPGSARIIARRALASVRRAHEALEAGDVLLLYPEGSRSRTGRLRPFLGAVHRYLAMPGIAIVPLALIGTNDVMPIGDDHLHPHAIRIAIGPPLDAIGKRGAKIALEAAHSAITELLPEPLRP